VGLTVLTVIYGKKFALRSSVNELTTNEFD